MKVFLQALSKNPYANPMCESRIMGQIYNFRGEPIFPNLRHTHYEDESGNQWRISFFQISKNKVKIYRLIQASFVTDTKHIT
ncbi:MAG: hypothetical protein K2H60_03135, partial [Muribaculaceae bacterium]|nr:hypothetical protein [Muribaculaceae bacterium]